MYASRLGEGVAQKCTCAYKGEGSSFLEFTSSWSFIYFKFTLRKMTFSKPRFSNSKIFVSRSDFGELQLAQVSLNS